MTEAKALTDEQQKALERFARGMQEFGEALEALQDAGVPLGDAFELLGVEIPPVTRLIL